MKYHMETFGCKSNQYESQAIREALRAAGHSETAAVADADVYIVNTCGVTGRAGASCRNAIRKAVRARPGIGVVITGCGVDLDETWPELPSPPILVPNAKKHAIADAVALFAGAAEEKSWNAVPDDRFNLAISRFEGHTRAFLKVQDGCDNFCAYCAVPYARGVPESRVPEAVFAEAERLTAAGHAELVLTGINIGAYEYNGLSLAALVAKLAETKGLERLRLGSVEPPQLTEELVRAMADNPRICPHVHLPLQSGDDEILRAMRRRYTADDFLAKIELLNRYLDRPAVSTDVIVGFPGENEGSAEKTQALCGRAGFSRMHVFLFSARPGTPAAAMKQTSTDAEIERRKTSLIRLGKELAERYASLCVGLRERVIVERSGGGLCDRYVRVALSEPSPPGGAVGVAITGANGAELAADPLRM